MFIPIIIVTKNEEKLVHIIIKVFIFDIIKNHIMLDNN